MTERMRTERKQRMKGVYPYPNGRFAVRRGTPGKPEHHSSFHKSEDAALIVSAIYTAIDEEEKYEENFATRLRALKKLLAKRSGTGSFKIVDEMKRDELWNVVASDNLDILMLSEHYENEVSEEE